MTLTQEFIPLKLENLHREAAVLKTEGWRFIQTHAVKADEGVDLYYSFMKDGRAANYRVAGVTKDDAVPSITDLFLAAFVFENEARELFGVDMRDIAIDFAGAMYAPAIDEPMTFISSEQKAAREKAKKAAAAKAVKTGDDGESGSEAKSSRGGFVMTPERQARLDAKMATMSPDKVEKVKAALAARAAEAEASSSAPVADRRAPESAKHAEAAGASSPHEKAAATDAQLEATLANLDPEKAAKVRAALAGKSASHAAAQVSDAPSSADGCESSAIDEQVSALIGLMDESKASVVVKALNMKGAE